MTVIDYTSRSLLACSLSWSYRTEAVYHALDEARAEAERFHGPLKKPPFVVTDNGSSFISRRFRQQTRGRYGHVRIQYLSPTQLGLLERFHRTLKEEEIHWRMYDQPTHCPTCLAEFRERYNEQRPLWAFIPATGGDPYTPSDFYREGHPIRIPKWQARAMDAQIRLANMIQEEPEVG